jgi:hypothetical protein
VAAWTIAAVGSSARADEPEKPASPRHYTPYVDRGAAVPAPYVYGTLGVGGIVRPEQRPQVELTLGGGLGLSQRLWVDGYSGTLRVAPELLFHTAQIGLSALLFDDPALELSAMLHVNFASDDGRPVEQIEPGLYVVARAAHEARVDTGLFLDVNPGSATPLGLRVPVAVGFQLSTHVHALLSTGVTVGSFDDAGRTTAIPAGVGFGWSDYLGEGPESVALLPSLSFPELWKPGAREPFRPGYAVFGVTFAVVTSR